MKKLLFVLLLSISSVVHAQWFLVGENSEGRYYIELSTIQQIGQYKRAWTRFEFFIDSKMNTKMNVRSDRGMNEYDCNERKYRRLNYQIYKQPNFIEQIHSSNKVWEWEFIAPDTVLADGLNLVCKK